MFEVWYESGRTRKVVARFRLLKDAETYLAQHDGEGTLEIVPAAAASAPRARRSGAATSSSPPNSAQHNSSSPPNSSSAPPTSQRGASSEPPDSDARHRRHSGVQGRVCPEVIGAVEHPDEFIADRVGNGEAPKE